MPSIKASDGQVYDFPETADSKKIGLYLKSKGLTATELVPAGFAAPRTAFQKQAAKRKLDLDVQQTAYRYEQDINKVKADASKLVPMATAAGAAMLVPGGQPLSLSLIGSAAGVAAIGGAGGEALRQIAGSVTGFDVTESSGAAAKHIGLTAAEQAAYEVGGRAILRPVEKLAGSLKTGLLSKAVSREPENVAVARIARETKAPLTAAEITNKPGLRELQKMYERTATGIGKATERRTAVNAALNEATEKVLSEFGSQSTSAQAAGRVKSAMEVSETAFHGAAEKLYEPFRTATKDLPVAMTGIKEKAVKRLEAFAADEYKATSLAAPNDLKQFLADLSNLQGKRELVKDASGKWMGKATADASFDLVWKLEQKAGELAGAARRSKEFSKARTFMDFKNELRAAQDKALEAVDPALKSRWTDIRKFYSEGIGHFRDEAVGKLMKKDGEAVLRSLNKTEDIFNLKKALAHGGDEVSWDATRRYYAQKLLGDPQATGTFVLEGLSEKIKQLPPEVKEVLSSSLRGTADKGAAMLKNLNDIGLAADRVRKITPMSSSVMMRDMVSLALFKFVKFKTALTFGAARILGGGILARIAENPAATRAMIEGIDSIPKGDFGRTAVAVTRAVSLAVQSGNLGKTIGKLDQVNAEAEAR
jgi:hypothetical protein